jgi:hypothetical protein
MVVYAYLPMGEQPEKSILNVRNPKNRKERFRVEYLKEKAFSEFREREKECGRHVFIAGHTKFKPFYENEKGNQQFFLNGFRYRIESEKSLFRHVKGYVKVKPLYETGELQEISDNSNTTHFIAVTRLTLIPLLLFLLPFLLCMFSHCPKAPDKPMPEPTPADTITQIVEQTTMPTDSDVAPWDGELPTSPSSETDQEEIEIIGYDKLTVSDNSRFVNLINPKGNTVYLKYSVKANGVEVYNTELIPPNMYIPWNAYSTLTQMGLSGEVNIEFNISTFDINSYAPCNPATIKTTITIN